jgi:dTDP-4-amino-4,6-dideoxygalactose transaminase
MSIDTAVRQIPFGRPWVSDEERAAVLDVLNGHVLTHGPQCKEFEREFGAFLGPEAHCVTVSSCMAALHLSYLHFGIGAGDEVIVPAQTHSATAHAVEWVGARPVFIDCDPATGNVTAASIEAAITPRTRALSVVHFIGIPCDMHAIMEIARRHNLKVIEDCAIALGARLDGTHVGLFGDAGCFSFYPVKHITTGEGGMFVSRHQGVAEKVARLRAFGVDRTHSERSIPGMYDVPELGLNYRMSEMQAAMGRVQMRRIGENLARRAANFHTLESALAALPNVAVVDAPGPAFQNSHYCLTARLVAPVAAGRNGLVARLNARGVGTSIYYPQPVPRMTYYRTKYGYDAAGFRGAEALSDDSLALPVGPHLGEEEMLTIAAEFRNALQDN